jgi:hypothetical protein
MKHWLFMGIFASRSCYGISRLRSDLDRVLALVVR